MDTAVNKLLDVDREARQMLDEAQQYYDHTLLEIEEEKKKLLAAYSEETKNHISEMEAELAREVDSVVRAVERRARQLLAGMEAQYERHHERWENELFEKTVMEK